MPTLEMQCVFTYLLIYLFISTNVHLNFTSDLLAIFLAKSSLVLRDQDKIKENQDQDATANQTVTLMFLFYRCYITLCVLEIIALGFIFNIVFILFLRPHVYK